MKRRWPTRVLIKYILLQLPLIVLLPLLLLFIRQWANIPLWLIWGLVALLIVKDIIMFPIVWRSYDQSRPGDATSIVGMRGTTTEKLAPSGYVQIRGELWRAEVIEGATPIKKGERIRVVEIRGLTLLVQPDNKDNL